MTYVHESRRHNIESILPSVTIQDRPRNAWFNTEYIPELALPSRPAAAPGVSPDQRETQKVPYGGEGRRKF